MMWTPPSPDAPPRFRRPGQADPLAWVIVALTVAVAVLAVVTLTGGR